MFSKFIYLKKNLFDMAELTLEQVLLLSDVLEQDDYQLANQVIERDDRIDDLEKENDNLSQNAILEAVASRNLMKKGANGEPSLKDDPLRFALSAIRITRYLERMGDQAVSCARVFKNKNIRPGIFLDDEDLALLLSRMVTIVGMAVESLVEEKDRFFGSVQIVEDELDRHCNHFFHATMEKDAMLLREFADLYRIILCIERMGDLAVNVSMEQVRLTSGQDIRHLFPSVASLGKAL